MSFDYRRFYDRAAPFYGFAFPLWRRYAERVLPCLPETGTMLEIGPGPGILHKKIAARYPCVVGLDLSPGMLRQTRRRLDRAGLVPQLVHGNAIRLPFASARFLGKLS